MLPETFIIQSSGDEIEEIQPVQASVLQPISITHTPSPKLKVEQTFQSSGIGFTNNQ